MRKHRHSSKRASGFTLVEMLVSMAILSLLMIMLSLLFSAASKVSDLSGKRISADSEARLVFDRMAQDFAQMLPEADVDFHFIKQARNDALLVFCQVPGYFTSSTIANPQSNLALIGYRINAQTNQLERLAKGLYWDSPTGGSSGSSDLPVEFLTFAGSPSDYTPTSGTTIIQRWPSLAPATSTDADYHVLGESVFRLEYYYLLTDGSYSDVPALANVTVSGTTIKCNDSADGPPTSSANTSAGYAVGSRWYDGSNFQGYICTNATSTTAVWKPLGMQDVVAIGVAIAILDPTSQKMISSNTSALASIANALSDSALSDSSPPTAGQPPALVEQTWENHIEQSGFATSIGVPKAVAAQIRIYHRLFYLSNL